MHDDLKSFFLLPKTSKQRHYEALRAYVIDETPARQVAERFGFTEKSLYALAHDLRTGKLEIFPKPTTGPKDRRATPYVRQKVSLLRKQGLSVNDVVETLKDENILLSLPLRSGIFILLSSTLKLRITKTWLSFFHLLI